MTLKVGGKIERVTDRKENCCIKDLHRRIPGQVLMNSNCPSLTNGLLWGGK